MATELKPLLDHIHGRHDQVVRYLLGEGEVEGEGEGEVEDEG